MHILHLISSPRKGASSSIALGNAIIEKLQEANPGSTVKVRDLTEPAFPHLAEGHLVAFHTPAESRTPEQQQAVRQSDESIAELMAADILVVGAPLYNFGITSNLKAWIDHVTRANITFRYSPTGAEGLVTGKKAYIAMSSGGIYSDGPMKESDFVSPYLKVVLGFIGITDVSVVRVEGTAIPGLQETAMDRALSSIPL
jgi:FMN-dependent NADH-azoreductase